jgi:hypothetical protein
MLENEGKGSFLSFIKHRHVLKIRLFQNDSKIAISVLYLRYKTEESLSLHDNRILYIPFDLMSQGRCVFYPTEKCLVSMDLQSEIQRISKNSLKGRKSLNMHFII